MELSKKLCLMTLVVLLASCNEKVSPELKDSGVTSDTSGSGAAPEEYYMKVTDKSPVLLNYKLHRTGAGNINKPCEVRSSTVAFSSDSFRNEGISATDHDNKIFDVTCYYNMEELALYGNGFKFEIEASKNTCEYIGYSPFSFFDRIPGDSSSSITRVECTGTTTATAALTTNGQTIAQDSTGTYAECGQVVDRGLAFDENLSAAVADPGDEGLCRFNYTSQNDEGREPGQNCDIGIINLTTLSVVQDSAGLTTITPSLTTVRCGGKISNCIQGPHKDEFASQSWTRGVQINSSEKDETFKKEYEYDNLIDSQRFGTYRYANFRSTLASPVIDYGTYSDDVTALTIWTSNADRKTFNPNVMEYYSANRELDSATELIDNDAWIAASVVNGYTARPYAADPFLGLSFGNITGEVKNSKTGIDTGVVSYRTQPYYTISCMDAARDIKARIRIAIRDWDRNFNVVTHKEDLEAISDYRGETFSPNVASRQDNSVEQEIPGDPGFFNEFNDYNDWDNLVPMDRTSVAPIVWDPESGFFNVNIFTNGYF